MKYFTKEAATAVMTALILGGLLITDISATVLSNTTQYVASVVCISLDKSSMNLEKGKSVSLSAEITYDRTDTTEVEGIMWTSEDESIATVDEYGTICALANGTTRIICSSESGTVTARCKLTVHPSYNMVKKLSLDKTLIHMNKGDSRTLTPVATYKSTEKDRKNEPIVWSSSEPKIAIVDENGVVTGKKNGTAYIIATSKYSGKKAKCKVVVQKTKYIAFTFDDGPSIYTDKLLTKLSKHHCQATFFVVGNRVGSYEDELLREQALGMEIGNHSYSHKNLNVLSDKALKAELSKCSKAIKKVTGQNPTLLRPPYGNHNKTVRKAAGMPVIMWSVDTLDWKYRDSTYVKNYILKHAGNGQIILLHDIHKSSVNGFIKALPTLRERGYELVTISELYEINGIEMEDGSVYNGIH